MYRLMIVHPDKAACNELLHILDWQKYGFTSVTTVTQYGQAVSQAMDMPPHMALVSVRIEDQWGGELVSQLQSQGLRTVFAMVSDQPGLGYMAKSLREFVERTIVDQWGGTLPKRTGGKVDPVLKAEYQSFSKVTQKILLYTRSHYSGRLSLTDMAEEMGMSSKYMGRVFIRDTGWRYSDYLMHYRMLEAQKLILGTTHKISVIANMVGYSQTNNFYTHFKQCAGASPTELREAEERRSEGEKYGADN